MKGRSKFFFFFLMTQAPKVPWEFEDSLRFLSIHSPSLLLVSAVSSYICHISRYDNVTLSPLVLQ